MKTIIPEELFISQRLGNLEKHIDENGVKWYDFEKLVNSLKMKYSWAKELYDEIEDYNKDIFEVLNKYGREENKRFITSEAMCKLLSNARENLQIINDFLEAILEDEKQDSNDCCLYEQQVEILSNAINSHNDKFICKAVRQIAQTDVYKNTLDKVDPTFDKEIEDAVDKIRDYMYENEVKEILALNDKEEIILELNKEDDVWSYWINQ